MKIDMSKVSPRPWKIEVYNTIDHETDEKYEAERIIDADGEPVGTPEWWPTIKRTDSERYVVHCVNLHDRLVAALEKANGWIRKFNETIDETPREVMEYLYQSDKLLTEARGDK